MLCRWYWPRFGGRVNCFLISAEEYRLIFLGFQFLVVQTSSKSSSTKMDCGTSLSQARLKD